MKRLLLLIIFISSVSGSIYASDAGSTGANFLKIGVGARPAALGDTFTGIADDINSIYWNPAGLSTIDSPEAILMQGYWLAETNCYYMGYAFPNNNREVFGISATYLAYGNIQGYNSLGEAIHTISPYDMAVTVSYAYSFSSSTSIGLNLKTISSSLGDANSSSYAIDIGYLYQTINSPVKIGAVLQNMGPGIRYSDETFSLPVMLRIGASYPYNKGILLASDYVLQQDNSGYFTLGCEYMINSSLITRLGYKSLSDTGTNLSGGICVKYEGISFDYAYVPYGNLGDTHRFSVGMIL